MAGNSSFFVIFALLMVIFHTFKIVSSKSISMGDSTYDRPYESPKNESLNLELSMAKVSHQDYVSILYPPDVNAIIVRWRTNNCSPGIFCGNLQIGIYDGPVRGEMSLVADRNLPVEDKMIAMIIKRADKSRPLIIQFLNKEHSLPADGSVSIDILPAFDSPLPKHYMIVSSKENQEVYTYCFFNKIDLEPFETDMKNCPVPSTSGPNKAGTDLNTGIIVGIAVAAVIIIGVVICILVNRKKLLNREKPPPPDTENGPQSGKNIENEYEPFLPDNQNKKEKAGSNTRGQSGQTLGGQSGQTGNNTGGQSGQTGNNTGGQSGQTGNNTGGQSGQTGNNTGGQSGQTGNNTGFGETSSYSSTAPGTMCNA